MSFESIKYRSNVSQQISRRTIPTSNDSRAQFCAVFLVINNPSPILLLINAFGFQYGLDFDNSFWVQTNFGFARVFVKLDVQSPVCFDIIFDGDVSKSLPQGNCVWLTVLHPFESCVSFCEQSLGSRIAASCPASRAFFLASSSGRSSSSILLYKSWIYLKRFVWSSAFCAEPYFCQPKPSRPRCLPQSPKKFILTTSQPIASYIFATKAPSIVLRR